MKTINKSFGDLIVRKKDNLFKELSLGNQLPALIFDRIFASNKENEFPFKLLSHKPFKQGYLEIENNLVSHYAKAIERLYRKAMANLSDNDVQEITKLEKEKTMTIGQKEFAILSNLVRNNVIYEIFAGHHRLTTMQNS